MSRVHDPTVFPHTASRNKVNWKRLPFWNGWSAALVNDLAARECDRQAGEILMAKDDIGSRFEIPADLRALAEKSVEQAKQAFDMFISAAQHAVSTVENQTVSAQAGAKEVGGLAIEFAERNIASSFDFAQKLLQAREPKDVIELHTEYVHSQIAALTDQAKELSKRASKMSGLQH
jgi:phasin